MALYFKGDSPYRYSDKTGAPRFLSFPAEGFVANQTVRHTVDSEQPKISASIRTVNNRVALSLTSSLASSSDSTLG
ncbi:hypothetical protein [Variovorax sp.]|uniref:hypothetical protein n=1 Tax=Variovorax sp. TaxID=1871043 RepID=UPI00137C5CBB|nr:hypothetical protein [Variovorax sp.]KAF1061305.1 MAG: hypothetical protein GAK39_05789 [Variovorax sp.]